MKVTIIFPPCADPTMPYLSLPALNACFRKSGWQTTLVDANAEGWRYVLSEAVYSGFCEKAHARCLLLQEKSVLGHEEAGELVCLQDSLHAAPSAQALEEAVRTFDSAELFYDHARYRNSVEIMEAAFALISAAFYPVEISFAGFKDKFSLLNRDEIDESSDENKMPFSGFFKNMAVQIGKDLPDLIAVSCVYTSQIQCAMSLAAEIRKNFPGTKMIIGGQAVSQIAERCFRGDFDIRDLNDFLGPFDSLVAGEAEEYVKTIDLHRGLEKLVFAGVSDEFKDLCPDYDGMDFSRYFIPARVVSYDAARGCYWGLCAFCHYGLSGCTTAAYRQRESSLAAAQMKDLQSRWNAEVVFLSEDTLSVEAASGLAEHLNRSNVFWATDIRAEAGLNAELCDKLKKGGCLCLTIGAESGNQRILKLMGKGTRTETVEQIVKNISDAGIACEGMYFLDFPTETTEEALQTLSSIKKLKDHLSLFICGQFELTAGSRVALHPADFSIEEVFTVEGDTWRQGCFYIAGFPLKVRAERRQQEQKLHELSGEFKLSSYPWAGSLSTAHTFLYYKKFGPGVFREGFEPADNDYEKLELQGIGFLDDKVAHAYNLYEEKIWDDMIYEFREVSRSLYDHLNGGLQYKLR